MNDDAALLSSVYDDAAQRTDVPRRQRCAVLYIVSALDSNQRSTMLLDADTVLARADLHAAARELFLQYDPSVYVFVMLYRLPRAGQTPPTAIYGLTTRTGRTRNRFLH